MHSNTGQSSPPAMRVLTFGLFALERLIHPSSSFARFPQYEPVPTRQWSNHGPALTMLKLLICRPGRRASKDVLIEGLWPGEKSETINVEHALHSAASALRQMLRTPEGSRLLETTRGSDGIGYKLPPQETLWVDADAFEEAVQQALDATQQGNDSLLWWENAYRLAKGIFLPDDMYSEWAQARRETLRGHTHLCTYQLAALYSEQNRKSEAEVVLRAHWATNPTDEDTLCFLMTLLSTQGRYQEALQLYEQTRRDFEEDSLEVAASTTTLVLHLQDELLGREVMLSSFPKTIEAENVTAFENPFKHSLGRFFTHRAVEEAQASSEFLGYAALRTNPLWMDEDILSRLEIVLHHPSGIGEKEARFVDEQTRLYWRAREDSIFPASTLYTHVIRHVDDIATFLASSLLPTIRLYLCEIICRTVLLAGILQYDMGQYEHARRLYQLAFQAASEANNPTLQALVWGWVSFTWTYSKQFADALLCLQQANHFATKTPDMIVQAWLGAIDAEIQAHLQDRTACLQSLDLMERAFGATPSQDISYLFEFNPVLLLGYKGVCLQELYRKQEPTTHHFLQEAKEALAQALASDAPVKRKLYYLSDLAGVYARQGEVETACSYVTQTVPLIIQVGNGSKTIRQHLLQARSLLRPYERTSYVQALDERMAPLLDTKHQ